MTSVMNKTIFENLLEDLGEEI